MLIGEVGDGDRVFPGQPVASREHGYPWFRQERLDLQAALVDRQANVADIGPAVVQHSSLVVPVGAQYVHSQLRVADGQGADGSGHNKAGHEPDREGAWVAGRAGNPAAQRVRTGQQRSRIGQQLPAGRGQLGCPLVPHEQRRFQLLFERPDLAGQYRLGDVQGLGGAAEVQMLSDGDEIAQLAEVDVSHGLLPSLMPPEYYRRANRSWTGATPAAHRRGVREQQNVPPHLSRALSPGAPHGTPGGARSQGSGPTTQLLCRTDRRDPVTPRPGLPPPISRIRAQAVKLARCGRGPCGRWPRPARLPWRGAGGRSCRRSG